MLLFFFHCLGGDPWPSLIAFALQSLLWFPGHHDPPISCIDLDLASSLSLILEVWKCESSKFVRVKRWQIFYWRAQYWTQSGSSSQSDRSNEEGGARKEGIEESHEDEGVQCNGDTNHAIWQLDMDSDEETWEQTRGNRNGLPEKSSRSDEKWQSKECRCEGDSKSREGDGESEKETKSMEGETGADGRWQISEESVHWGNCREKAKRKTEKEIDWQFLAIYKFKLYLF